MPRRPTNHAELAAILCLSLFWVDGCTGCLPSGGLVVMSMAALSALPSMPLLLLGMHFTRWLAAAIDPSFLPAGGAILQLGATVVCWSPCGNGKVAMSAERHHRTTPWCVPRHPR
jgi:hypothetical protein